MGSAEIIAGSVESVFYGTTSVPNPILFMEVDGTPVASGYVIQRIGSSVRYIFPRITNGNIYITAIGQVYGSDLPAITNSIKILVAN